MNLEDYEECKEEKFTLTSSIRTNKDTTEKVSNRIYSFRILEEKFIDPTVVLKIIVFKF